MLTRWIDSLLDPLVDRKQRTDRSLVERGPEASRGLLLRGLARAAAGLVAVWLLDSDGLLETIAYAVVGGIVGATALQSHGRALAYRSGYIDGRKRFVDQMEHHQQQGNTPRQWLETELLHDLVNVWGARIEIRDPEEDE